MMEDPDEIANYRLRPRSRTSSQVTPSPNTSSYNLPCHGSAQSTEVSEHRDISSSFLQERLEKKRTETLKVQAHRRGSDSTADDRIRIGSTPTVAPSDGRFGDRRPSTSTPVSEKKSSMGVKGMEEVSLRNTGASNGTDSQRPWTSYKSRILIANLRSTTGASNKRHSRKRM